MRWMVGLINFHSEIVTDKCIRSLLEADFESLEIVIVDNSQSIHSLEYRGLVTVLDLGENLGFAGGANALLDYARIARPDALWILNNDCIIRADAPSKFEVAIASSQYDVFTSVIASGWSERIWYAGGELERSNGRTSHIGFDEPLSSSEWPGVVETQWASGASMVLPLGTILSCTQFDARFFLYLEEVDWQVRGQMRIGVVGEPLVTHFAGTTTGKWSTSMEQFFTARNRVLLRRSLGLPRIGGWALFWVADFILRPTLRGRFMDLRVAMLALMCVRKGGLEALLTLVPSAGNSSRWPANGARDCERSGEST